MNEIKFYDSVSQAEKDNFQIQKLIGQIKQINQFVGCILEDSYECFKRESNY
jgi:hypothetical protein